MRGTPPDLAAEIALEAGLRLRAVRAITRRPAGLPCRPRRAACKGAVRPAQSNEVTQEWLAGQSAFVVQGTSRAAKKSEQTKFPLVVRSQRQSSEVPPQKTMSPPSQMLLAVHGQPVGPGGRPVARQRPRQPLSRY